MRFLGGLVSYGIIFQTNISIPRVEITRDMLAMSYFQQKIALCSTERHPASFPSPYRAPEEN